MFAIFFFFFGSLGAFSCLLGVVPLAFEILFEVLGVVSPMELLAHYISSRGFLKLNPLPFFLKKRIHDMCVLQCF